MVGYAMQLRSTTAADRFNRNCLSRITTDRGYLSLLIGGPAPPRAMAPPLPGRECAAIAEHEGTAKAPGTLIVSPER
jgi:hypothetical protein